MMNARQQRPARGKLCILKSVIENQPASTRSIFNFQREFEDEREMEQTLLLILTSSRTCYSDEQEHWISYNRYPAGRYQTWALHTEGLPIVV